MNSYRIYRNKYLNNNLLIYSFEKYPYSDLDLRFTISYQFASNVIMILQNKHGDYSINHICLT